MDLVYIEIAMIVKYVVKSTQVTVRNLVNPCYHEPC